MIKYWLLAMNYRSSIDYYLIIDQEDYDTNVAVQMYAPGAATGWYAQEPETNWRFWNSNYPNNHEWEEEHRMYIYPTELIIHTLYSILPKNQNTSTKHNDRINRIYFIA